MPAPPPYRHPDAMPPSQAAIDSAEKLYRDIEAAFPKAIEIFESRWVAWQSFCEDNAATAEGSSEMFMSAESPSGELDALKSLGPKIVPMVVHKLAQAIASQANLIGVYLYKQLGKQDDYYLVADLDEPFPNSVEVLQRLSNGIVEVNHKRYQDFLKIAKDWYDLAEEESNSSRWGADQSLHYHDLKDMGPSIVAHGMVEYARSPKCAWHELLHELIHGRRMGSYIMQHYWPVVAPWFNEGEWEDAPKWIPGILDRQILFGEQGPAPPPDDLGHWGTMKDKDLPIVREGRRRGAGPS